MKNETHYIGLDVHKKSIQFCAKTADGTIVDEGRIAATHHALQQWSASRTQPWKGAMEATMFSAWIYDVLRPHAAELKVAHPAMLKAIAASKHASDRLDACKIAELVRAWGKSDCVSMTTPPPRLIRPEFASQTRFFSFRTANSGR